MNRAEAPYRRFLRVRQPEAGHPIVRQFFALLQQERVSIELVAGRAGYGQTTIHKWRTREWGPTVKAMNDCLQILGYELRVVRRKSNDDLSK